MYETHTLQPKLQNVLHMKYLFTNNIVSSLTLHRFILLSTRPGRHRIRKLLWRVSQGYILEKTYS